MRERERRKRGCGMSVKILEERRQIFQKRKPFSRHKRINVRLTK